MTVKKIARYDDLFEKYENLIGHACRSKKLLHLGRSFQGIAQDRIKAVSYDPVPFAQGVEWLFRQPSL